MYRFNIGFGPQYKFCGIHFWRILRMNYILLLKTLLGTSRSINYSSIIINNSIWSPLILILRTSNLYGEITTQAGATTLCRDFESAHCCVFQKCWLMITAQSVPRYLFLLNLDDMRRAPSFTTILKQGLHHNSVT